MPSISETAATNTISPAAGVLVPALDTNGTDEPAVVDLGDLATASALTSGLAGKASSSHTHAASDIASGTVATARLGSGTADNTKFLRGDQTWQVPSGGSTPSHSYFTQLAALLEPDAIEPIQKGAFSDTISGSATKWLLLGRNTQLDATGQLETHDARSPIPLRGVTLAGVDSAGCAILLDPTLPTYTDAWTTYYDRLNTIATTAPKVVSLSTAGAVPFLPGAYGAIITGVSGIDTPHVTIRVGGTYYLHLAANESDSAAQRVGFGMTLAAHKAMAGEFCVTAGTGKASLTYILVPSSWSKVTDATTYLFRDDFMGASLNTGSTWTRAVSTAGNVEINTTYQWLKLVGNTTWGTNGIYAQTGHARSNQRTLTVDVYNVTSSNFLAGWSDGAGHSYTNFAHGIQFNGTGMTAWENSNNRGTVGSGLTANTVYRLRIRALSGGGATYSIQGGSQYEAIGSASWTDITPGTSSSATSTLYPALNAYNTAAAYAGDMRVT